MGVRAGLDYRNGEEVHRSVGAEFYGNAATGYEVGISPVGVYAMAKSSLVENLKHVDGKK